MVNHVDRQPFPAIDRGYLTTLQVNLGYRCNQSCLHCHVMAGPKRHEVMNWETMTVVQQFVKNQSIATVDLTGGAPELNPEFRRLITLLHDLDVQIIDRCNLTVLEEDGQQDLPEFLARHGIHIVASLPCYLMENVDRQRGNGAFSSSLAALRRLNALGYGVLGSNLLLDLVYNPQQPVLPPAQQQLETDYRRELAQRYGISFSHLRVMTNMPLGRFAERLRADQQLAPYHTLLQLNHCQDNLNKVMCRTLISVNWQGMVYDCDFNQMLGLPIGINRGEEVYLSELMNQDLTGQPIRTGNHCYGCTVGQGSGCGGALA
ncbi:MAG: arsenosugar biosynthesis radical SAM protein ArsS [Magnetococcales bacterium]|nr:arsenosugar biosynthesis radical SAM protein ArsS [Magnetococcales bacterium]